MKKDPPNYVKNLKIWIMLTSLADFRVLNKLSITGVAFISKTNSNESY